MKRLQLAPRDQRLAAIGLLLVALVLAYLVLLHWWFVAPLSEVSSEMTDLRATQSRYAAAIAQKPALEQRLASMGADQAASSAFLAEDDPNAASASLMQRVVDVAAAHAQDGRCEVTQKMPLPTSTGEQSEPYRKAGVSISLRCDIQPLAAVMHDLEQGTPYLFIDDLSIYRNPVVTEQGGGAPLEVQFTLSGYVHPARATAAPAMPADASGPAA